MIRSAIASLFARPRGHAARCCVPTLEALEDRLVPSVTGTTGPVASPSTQSALVAAPSGPTITTPTMGTATTTQTANPINYATSTNVAAGATPIVNSSNLSNSALTNLTTTNPSFATNQSALALQAIPGLLAGSQESVSALATVTSGQATSVTETALSLTSFQNLQREVALQQFSLLLTGGGGDGSDTPLTPVRVAYETLAEELSGAD